MTQAELIAEAARRGVELEPRTLTSWRAKGLLPPLSDRGVGRGKGKTYSWAYPDVLSQALATQALLDRRSRADSALLGLWLCGYPVSSVRARELWLERLIAVKDEVARAADKAGSAGDYLATLSARTSSRLNEPAGVTRADIEAVISACLNPVYDLGDDFDITAEYEPVVAMLLGWIGTRDTSTQFAADLRSGVSEKRVEQVAAFFTLIFSLDARTKIVRRADHQDLEAARSFVESIRRILGRFLPPGSGPIPMPTFGEPLALLYLNFRRAGLEHLLDDSVRLLTQIVQNSAELAERRSAGQRLAALWLGQSLGGILRKLTAR